MDAVVGEGAVVTREHGALDEFIIRCLESGKYRVDADGSVHSLNWNRSGIERRLQARPNRSGYWRIHLRIDGYGSDVMLHRVVAIACLGLPPSQHYEVDHIDMDKSNNAAANLEWVNRSQNIGRSFARGVHKIPPRYEGPKKYSKHQAKLTEEAVREVHRRKIAGEKQCSIASAFGVSQSTISMIVSGKVWPEIKREFHT